MIVRGIEILAARDEMNTTLALRVQTIRKGKLTWTWITLIHAINECKSVATLYKSRWATLIIPVSWDWFWLL